jgi:hypothetical protein
MRYNIVFQQPRTVPLSICRPHIKLDSLKLQQNLTENIKKILISFSLIQRPEQVIQTIGDESKKRRIQNKRIIIGYL